MPFYLHKGELLFMFPFFEPLSPVILLAFSLQFHIAFSLLGFIQMVATFSWESEKIHEIEVTVRHVTCFD